MEYEIQEYINPSGKSYFRGWFNKIGANAAAKITAALYKLEKGNFADTKAVSNGILEFRINAGPGYRIYFAKVGKKVILLLAGGTKRGQNKDIQLATSLYQEYKKLKLH